MRRFRQDLRRPGIAGRVRTETIPHHTIVWYILGMAKNRELDEPATKGDLKNEIQLLRTELKGDMNELRTELKGDMNELRTELKGDMNELRTELKGDMNELRTELKGEIQGVKGDVLNLQFDVKDLKEGQKETMKVLQVIQGAVMALDERVRYQQDLPERVEQLEQDTHELKREVYKLKSAK